MTDKVQTIYQCRRAKLQGVQAGLVNLNISSLASRIHLLIPKIDSAQVHDEQLHSLGGQAALLAQDLAIELVQLVEAEIMKEATILATVANSERSMAIACLEAKPRGDQRDYGLAERKASLVDGPSGPGFYDAEGRN